MIPFFREMEPARNLKLLSLIHILDYLSPEETRIILARLAQHSLSKETIQSLIVNDSFYNLLPPSPTLPKIKIFLMTRSVSNADAAVLHIRQDRYKKHKKIMDQLIRKSDGPDSFAYIIPTTNQIRTNPLLHNLILDMIQTGAHIIFDIYEGPDLPFCDIIDTRPLAARLMESIRDHVKSFYTLIQSSR